MTMPPEDETATVDEAVNDALIQLRQYDANSKEYADIVKQIETLHSLLPPKKENKVSKDALIAVAGNLLGIVFILHHERFNVITSKALSFVLKTRF